MRAEGLLIIANALLFLGSGFMALGFQCSLWLQTLGSTPPPLMWIPYLVYFSLYRHRTESLLAAYTIAAVMAGFSVMPLGPLLVCLLLIYFGIDMFKQRIFWGGVSFFAPVVGAVAVVFPILNLILSWLFDKNPIHELGILNTILSALFTTLVSFPLYSFFCRIDAWTRKELPTEAGSQIL